MKRKSYPFTIFADFDNEDYWIYVTWSANANSAYDQQKDQHNPNNQKNCSPKQDVFFRKLIVNTPGIVHLKKL